MKKDIYIIKNSVNDKVYIGQSKNPAKRWLCHIYDARYESKSGRYKQLIHQAMVQLGVEKFHYEILESQAENPDEREKYWISRYGSVAPNGYNIAPGGTGCGGGLESVNAIFRTKDDLMRCVSEISGTSKTFTNIARKFGCSEAVISGINRGVYYRLDGLEYPLRNTDTRYSDSTVKQIRYSLKYEQDLTLSDIADKYNVDLSQVSLINQGKKYYLYSESYPLRAKRRQDLDNATLSSVIQDILYSNLCLSDIAAKHNLSRTRISGINQGTFYRRAGYKYPLRADNDSRTKSLKKFLDREVILEIHSMLRSGYTAREIADRYGISTTTVHNINNGKCKKYLIDGTTYPIRSFSQQPVSTIHV